MLKGKIHYQIFFILFFFGFVFSQIPQTMSYQGVLKNSGGAVVSDGNYSLLFKMYDVSTGGTALWTETHSSVAVSNGIFSVILGSVTAINLAFDKQYWLGVTVGTDSELSPRIKLAASPYSLNSQSVLGSSNTFPSSGNVGIGTTNPSSELDVNGAIKTTDLTIEKSTDTFTMLRMKHAGLTSILAFNLQVETSGFGQKISFAQGDSPYTRYFTIDAANQRVGIMTMSPKNTLDVEGSAAIGASYSESSSAPSNGLIVEGDVGIATASPTSSFEVNGSIGNSAITIVTSATYTATATDYVILGNYSALTTITLPSASGIKGRKYLIKRISASGTVTINTTSSQTIDGLSSTSLANQWGWIEVISDGANWLKIGAGG